MTGWLIVSMILLIWTALYCLRRSIDDFRAGWIKAGISGAVAFCGALSVLGIGLFAVAASLYFH